MKNPVWLLALAVATATLGYVAFRTFAPRAPNAAAAPLESQTQQVTRTIDDLSNAAENVGNAIKSAPPALRGRSGTEMDEMIRLVHELARANAAQQETIRQLSTASQKDPGILENAVTLVGIGSTLLTMLLAWRKDRREIDKLKAKLAAPPPAVP